MKIAGDSEQCSLQQDVCSTSEFNQFSLPVSTTTTAAVVTDVQSTITSTSTSTTVSTHPLLPVITTISLGAPPVTTAALPVTTPAPLATTPGVVTLNTRTFVVEPVPEDSGDEESIVNEETSTSVPITIDDAPSGQDERRDSEDTATTSDTSTLPVGDEGRTSASVQSDDESQRLFHQHTPPTTSPYPEGFRAGQATSDRPIVDHLSSLSESFSVLMYSVLQVLRNPAMESFVKDLDVKYGNGSGPVVHESSQDVEYQNLKMK